LTTVLLLVTALGVGMLIGGVGIGGILLSPLLAYVGGLDLHVAIATSLWSFLFTGLAATLMYARRGSVDRRMVLWLSGGIMPGAVVGARANGALPSAALTVLLAAACVASGLAALVREPTVERRAAAFGAPILLSIGALVGFGSALTGAGGAVLLVPILLASRASALVAVGASQAIQLPVVAAATLGYAASGTVDFALGTGLGMVEVIGVVLGARLAHASSPRLLRRLVALALVAAGWAMLLGPGVIRGGVARAARASRSGPGVGAKPPR